MQNVDATTFISPHFTSESEYEGVPPVCTSLLLFYNLEPAQVQRPVSLSPSWLLSAVSSSLTNGLSAVPALWGKAVWGRQGQGHMARCS